MALAAALALAPLVAIRPILALVITIVPLVGGLFGLRLGIMLVAIVIAVIVVALTARILVLEAGPALAQDAEIMVGELQIIFGLDTVARKLRVARHALVFLEQLGGVAALAIILTVTRLSANIAAAPLPATAAPAATLSIIDQMILPYAGVASPFGLWQAERHHS